MNNICNTYSVLSICRMGATHGYIITNTLHFSVLIHEYIVKNILHSSLYRIVLAQSIRFT